VSALAAPARRTQLPLRPQGDGGHERLRRSDGGRLTLEQKLDRVWEGLVAVGAAECPLCGSPMERAGDAGRCGGCGSALS
jgi:hypothetical protein